MTRDERWARNEALFRELNERINEIGDHFNTETLDIACECVDYECIQGLTLSQTDYGQLRSAPRQFAVAPGHEKLDLETVIERHDSYVVVEKLGLGAQVAEQLDRRGRQDP